MRAFADPTRRAHTIETSNVLVVSSIHSWSSRVGFVRFLGVSSSLMTLSTKIISLLIFVIKFIGIRTERGYFFILIALGFLNLEFRKRVDDTLALSSIHLEHVYGIFQCIYCFRIIVFYVRYPHRV